MTLNKKRFLNIWALFVVVAALIAALVFVGFSVTNKEDGPAFVGEDRQFGAERGGMKINAGTSTPVSADVFVVGERVTVIGAKNQDGSVAARMIYIGDFSVTGGSTLRGGAADFKMSGAGGRSVIMGEIIKKDDESITIKLNEGGSIYVFYSPSTQIFTR